MGIKKSIRGMILVPTLALGLVCILSSIVALKNIRSIDKNAIEIADGSMESILALSQIQEEAQNIYRMSLSHIVATDFNTMIEMVEQIRSEEQKLEDNISDITDSGGTDTDYAALSSDFEGFVKAVTHLTAVSANQDNALAYELANGDVKTCADQLEAHITQMKDNAILQKDERRIALRRTYKLSLVITVIAIIFSIATVVIAVMVVMSFVVKPIERTNKELDDIISGIDAKEGDLTKRISITSDDEIGALGEGINSFMKRLQKIFTLIAGDSDRINSVVKEVLGSIETSNASATDLSAVTEELSATMGEVAGSAATINNDAKEVHVKVSAIAEKTHELTRYSVRMKEHADEMEMNASESMNATDRKVNEILEVLNKAIEDAGSVDRVKSLTDNILSIASQTNLLALNASIEAARAGEAGKGFGVVAGEISNLAESSRDAASSIQEINVVITNAVHNLANHSQGLVDYMRESILPQFSRFVEDGEQYRTNATYIEEVMYEFEKSTNELEVISTEIAESISMVTQSINEGVSGISGAAASTQVLVNDMDNINRRMDENGQIAQDLQKETSVFKKM